MAPQDDVDAELPPDDKDLKCGLGSCRPQCLQTFNTPRAILVWLSWFAFLQGFMINGIRNATTSTLERRFHLTSSQAGSLSSVYDITASVFSLPVSYFGAHTHQPRLLTLAAATMATGSFIMIIPHFATDPYELGTSQTDFCEPSGDNLTTFNPSDCDPDKASEPDLSKWLIVMHIAMALNGFSGATLYSVGIVFLDNSVSAKLSSVYQGILFSSATLGPALGYLLGGYFVEKFYVDIDKLDTNALPVSPEDPRFVGAWWIGYLACGVLLCSVVVLLMCYPRELPGSRLVRLGRVTEAHHDGKSDVISSRPGFGVSYRDIPASCRLLVRNPVFLSVTFASVAESAVMSGMATFIAKFMQNQFSLTAGLAAIVGGTCLVPGAVGGQIVGGVVCKLAKLGVRGMLKLNVVISSASVFLCVIFLCQCPAPDMAGVNVDYDDVTTIRESLTVQELQNSKSPIHDPPHHHHQSVNLSSPCNSQCGCTTRSYEPICGSNNIQYFSPCHAGCQATAGHDNHDDDGRPTIFVNCSCIPSDPELFPRVEGKAYAGTCDVRCGTYYVFIPIFVLLIFSVFITVVPSLSVTLRCVPESQRTFALGVQSAVRRLVGAVPGPILMGYVFDSTCLVWQDKSSDCGGGAGDGSCWIYDNLLLSQRLIVLVVVVRALATCCFLVAWRAYRAPPSSTSVDNDPGSGADDVKDSPTTTTTNTTTTSVTTPVSSASIVDDDPSLSLIFDLVTPNSGQGHGKIQNGHVNTPVASSSPAVPALVQDDDAMMKDGTLHHDGVHEDSKLIQNDTTL